MCENCGLLCVEVVINYDLVVFFGFGILGLLVDIVVYLNIVLVLLCFCNVFDVGVVC